MSILTSNVTIDGQKLVKVISDSLKKIQYTDGNVYSTAYVTSYKTGDFLETKIDVPYLSSGTIVEVKDVVGLDDHMRTAINTVLSDDIIHVIDIMDGIEDQTMTLDAGNA